MDTQVHETWNQDRQFDAVKQVALQSHVPRSGQQSTPGNPRTGRWNGSIDGNGPSSDASGKHLSFGRDGSGVA